MRHFCEGCGQSCKVIWAHKPWILRTVLERKEAERPDLGPHYEARKFLLALLSNFGLHMLAGASARHSRESSFDCSPHPKDTETARRQTCSKDRRISLISLSLYLSIYIISVPEYPKGTCFKSAEFGWTVGHKGYAWCILIHWVMQHASPFWKAGWTSHRRIFCLPSWEAIGIYLTTDHIKICIRIITVFIIH